MGGTIQVKSEPDKGTQFTLDFWMDVVQEAACAPVLAEEKDISIEGVRVLLCEDNELNMEIAVYLLEAGEPWWIVQGTAARQWNYSVLQGQEVMTWC